MLDIFITSWYVTETEETLVNLSLSIQRQGETSV